MIRVLIVEDDPMVAELNKRYLEEIDNFLLIGVAHSVHDALEYIDREEIDLILLDVYMPGQSGLDLLAYIRKQEKRIDVILITAASEVEKIQTALRHGVVDYLIKPFEFERLHQALMSYWEKYILFNKQMNLSQKELDQLLRSKEPQRSAVKSLPKGVTKATLQIVVKAIEGLKGIPFSTDKVAEETNISRVSIGKYLRFLKDIHVLEETITYGIGRPISLYVYKGMNDAVLKGYLE